MTAHFLEWLDRAARHQTAIADDERELSYAELSANARLLARAVRDEYGAGRYILLPAERDVDFLRALCAISFSGNIPVPIDPQAPAASLESLGAACGDWALWSAELAMVESAAPLDARNPELPALILFTSGTSGKPKGVVISQANLAHSTAAISAYLNYQENPSAAVVLPLHYSYALLSQIFCMLSVGGFSRIFSSFRNPLKFAKQVDLLKLQTFCGVPSTYQALCLVGRMAEFQMPTVKTICSAGAAMDRTLLPEIRKIFPAARFFDNYGMTEATPRISYISDDDPRFTEPTCGKAIDGLEIRILDEDTQAPLGDGEVGIVAIRGGNVFSGYLNDDAATQRSFTEEGFLLSGDLGYLRDGYLYIQGRRDEVFNVGGEKISPLEIERELADHPAIESSAVSYLEDPARGLVIVAYLRLGEAVNRKDLNQFLALRLPPVKIPARYFEVEEFPLTGNGKLQRARLSPENADLAARELG